MKFQHTWMMLQPVSNVRFVQSGLETKVSTSVNEPSPLSPVTVPMTEFSMFTVSHETGRCRPKVGPQRISNFIERKIALGTDDSMPWFRDRMRSMRPESEYFCPSHVIIPLIYFY